MQRPRPPAPSSASQVHPPVAAHNNPSLYNRQQSEPVTDEDFNYLNINGNVWLFYLGRWHVILLFFYQLECSIILIIFNFVYFN